MIFRNRPNASRPLRAIIRNRWTKSNPAALSDHFRRDLGLPESGVADHGLAHHRITTIGV